MYKSFEKIMNYKPSAVLSDDRITPTYLGHMVIAETLYECLFNMEKSDV